MQKEGSTDKGAKPKNVRVIALAEGFRRAGRSWSVAPTEVAVAEMSAEQLAALRGEPMLLVQDV